MVRYSVMLVLAAGLAAGALLSPAFGPDWTAGPSQGRALAEDATTEQPSWCSSPSNATERAICGDADLSSLDNMLNVAYGRAKHDSPKALADIEYVQKHWLLGQRNFCGTDVACLRKRYTEQIQILESYFAN